ncbi:MAG: hypothetical protein ACR2RE_01555, partial [Geminicoccaceae bacterium]
MMMPPFRILICTMFSTLYFVSGVSAQNSDDHRPAYPSETVCPTPLAKIAPGPWSAQEERAWDKRICLGEIADLSKRLDNHENACDPDKAADWPSDRMLTERFVQTVLFHEPFRSAYTRRGFRIRCAKIDQWLDLTNGRFDHEISFEDSVFENPIILQNFRSGGKLSFSESRLHGGLYASGLSVSGNVFLNNAEINGRIKNKD